MKKVWIKYIIILLVSFFSLNLFPVCAEQTEQMIIDHAHVLSEEKYNELNQYALDITERYHCAVYVLVVDDPSVNLNTIQEFAEDVYLSSDLFGYGPEKDGFMLVLSVSERCYWLLAYGEFGNIALTDYGKEVMSEQFIDHFMVDDWAGGFQAYLQFSEEVLMQASKGHPFDVSESNSSNVARSYGIGAFLALIISFFSCESSKNKMFTAVSSSTAREYIIRSKVNIAFRNEKFAYRTTTRAKIQAKNSTQSGTSVNDKGFSGKGGKF